MPKKNKGAFDFKNFFYGAGAAIVIVGAMFKFLGWNYADTLFLVGLTTEAIIFLYSGIEFKKQENSLKWEKVFPQLDPRYRGEKNQIDLIEAQEIYFKNTKQFVNSISSFTSTMVSLNDSINKLNSDVERIGTSIEKIDKASSTYEYELEQLAKRMHNLNAAYGQVSEAASKAINE
ncbi:MAG: gliding motility protein GldL [Bacteroidia bacterium]